MLTSRKQIKVTSVLRSQRYRWHVKPKQWQVRTLSARSEAARVVRVVSCNVTKNLQTLCRLGIVSAVSFPDEVLVQDPCLEETTTASSCAEPHRLCISAPQQTNGAMKIIVV